VSSPHRSLPHRVLSWGEPRSARASISRWCNSPRRSGRSSGASSTFPGGGTNNSGRSVTQARDQAVSTGLTINGLAIINDSPNLGYSGHSHPPGGLENYYRQNVIGGPKAFVLVVEDFKSFADAMANKPAKEIDVADRSAVGRISSRPSQ
jgi:hypothetical protein